MYRHVDLGEACERLGLPTPPDEGSKHQRVAASFAALPDADLPVVAERILRARCQRMPQPATRSRTSSGPARAHEIPKRTRREIARDLDLADLGYKARPVHGPPGPLVGAGRRPVRPWLTGGTSSLRARIERHVFRNPGDWSTEELFEQLGAFEASDTRFGRFLEGLASADVIPDEPAQRHIVTIVNPHLHSVGAELREDGTDGGYPVFTSSRLGRHATGSQRTSSSPRWRSPTSGSATLSTTTLRSSRTPTRSWSTTGPSAATASGGATCRHGGRTRSRSPTRRRPKSRCTRGSSAACPQTHPRSGTCSTSTTRSTAARCPTSRHSCPRYGCTGTRRQSASAAQSPAEIPHGLPAPSAPWPAGRPRSRRRSPLHQP